MLCREEMIVDLEARLFFRPAICAAKVSEKIELQTGRSLEKRTDSKNMLAWNNDRCFAEGFDYLAHPFRMSMLQRRHQRRRRCGVRRLRFSLCVRTPCLIGFFRHLSKESGLTPDPNLLLKSFVSINSFRKSDGVHAAMRLCRGATEAAAVRRPRSWLRRRNRAMFPAERLRAPLPAAHPYDPAQTPS